MTERPRSGARDNGLRCAGYTMIGDLDPRIADSLLAALRDEGIAAYVMPTPGSRGGYLEMRLPTQLTDRLYADSEHATRARELLPAPDPVAEIDFDSAWEQVVRSLRSPAPSPATDEAVPPWPSSEELARGRSVSLDLPTPVADPAPPGPAAEVEEHFVPPPPPPLPRLRRATVVSLLAIVVGIVVLVTNVDGGQLFWLAIIAIVSGVAALVWHMKDGPPVDSGWDDGAVV